MIRSACLILAVLLTALVAACQAPSVNAPVARWFLVGDSTMANQPDHKYPEQGWGQSLPDYLQPGVELQNHAMNGRSTKSFRDEGRWQAVLDQLRPGDQVVIGFGHNDQKIEDPARYAEPWSDYRANLVRYLDEAQANGAVVTLVTSIPRRQFDPQGELQETLGDYPAVVRQVAREKGVALVDLNQLTTDLLIEAGPEASKQFYMHAAPGQYPNLPPEGRQDNTHLQQAGARAVAGLFVAEARRQRLALTSGLK